MVDYGLRPEYLCADPERVGMFFEGVGSGWRSARATAFGAPADSCFAMAAGLCQDPGQR